MTIGEIEESVTCGGQRKAGGGGAGGGGGNMKLSFTTLSTIAIQAGQSQIVVSVLKSGSLVHLQLVQVHPGLCEIGSNQEENQTLIQEQQQLMDKLKKHEREVLAVVEKSRQTKQRRRRDEGMMEQKRSKKQEEEEGVYKAMGASLNEGWLLLLRLLERRQEVLMLTSDFYCRTLEFAVGIDKVEDLKIKANNDRLTEVQLTYDSMRRDLLEKSLQVLTSSNVLLQKLRQLQRTEALQRRGGVLQDEEAEEEESSQCSRGIALRLEELVETLQDRRRRADQAVRLQLQQVENRKKEQESRQAGSEDWSLTDDKILDQTLPSGSTLTESTGLKSDSKTKETRDLQSGSRSDVKPGCRAEETRNPPSGFKFNLKAGSRSDLKLGSKSEETRDLQPGSRSEVQARSSLDVKTESESTSEETKDFESGSRLDPKQSGFKFNLKVGSRSDLKIDSPSEETRDLLLGSRLEQTPGLRTELTPDIVPESRSEETKNFSGSTLDSEPKSISDLKVGSRVEESKDLQPESRPDLHPGFRLQFKPVCRLEEIQNLQSGFKFNLKTRSRSDLKLDSKLGKTINVPPGSTSEQKPGSRSDVQPECGLDVKPESGSELIRDVTPESTSEETKNFESGSRFDVKPESRSEPTRDVAPESRPGETKNFSGSRLDPRPESDLEVGSGLEDTKDLQPESRPDLQSGSRLEFKTGSSAKETRNLQSGFKLNLKGGSRPDLKLDSQSEKTRDVQPGSRSDMHPESRLDPKPESDLKPGSRLEESKDLQPESRSDLQPGFKLDFKPGSRLNENQNLLSGFKFNLKTGSRSDLKSDSKPEENRDFPPGSTSEQKPESRSDVQPETGLDVKPESRSEPTRDVAPESTSEETKNFESGSRLDPKQSGFKFSLKPGSRSDLKSDSKSEESRDLLPGSRSYVQQGSGLDMRPKSRSEPTRGALPGSTTEETKNFKSGSRLDQKPEFRLDQKPGSRLEDIKGLQPESRPQQHSGSRSDLQPVSESDLKHGTRSEETRDPQSGSGSEAEDKQEETKQHRAATTSTTRSRPVAGQESMLGNETQSGKDQARQALLTNQRQQLLSSCEHLVDKVWSWVQQGSSVLSNCSEAGQQLFEAEDTLKTHLQLQTQAESVGRDAENMKQILDQIRALHTDSTIRTSEPSRQLPPLKALTEQLKRGSTGRQTKTTAIQPSPPAAEQTGSLSPELAGQVDLVLKELQSLNSKIDSNLQLLQPYVAFLRRAKQVEEEMEGQREIYMRRPEEDEEEKKREGEEADSSNIRTTSSSSSPEKKKQVDACWQETLQRFLTVQELGNNYINTVPMVSGAGLNLQSVMSVVQQMVERLSRTKQEVNELRSQQQTQIQQQEYCRRYQERLLKTLKDLNCVSELLDSCTEMDLGSDLQTSKLLEHFNQAGPHFIQLDAEVEYMEMSWETLRGVQGRLELKGKEVKEEDLSELLKLQKSVKNKIHQSESILDLTSSFHRTSQQLEALLQSDLASPLTGSCGSTEAELSGKRVEQQQIQSLFETASTLKTDICTAINHSGWTCFRVEQLEARLLFLDSLCVSWLNEAARREEKLRRELLACRLNDDINQLRDSFKELKKRFSNLKFNYLKRNDRTRNMKAVRNQLQQVELYKEKLQALRKRLQGVTARLGSEVKDGGVAREAEDAINELQRQMGDFERNVSEHQKTLDMTRRLQQAMEEYQFWCEEASATIARVGKFSSECRSTEAVSVLYRQFEKFVWPTVPQQEERISQIAELAVRLHGVEEGQRYIEKTVSKHSEMVESIRELSDGLMELEAKLKRESLKKQQNEGEKEKKKEGETERRREDVTEEKDEEKEKKENRKMKKKELTDNRSTQEAADMYELKETGHTPELTAEHDGKEVPVKRQTAANRKPPLQKSRSLESDRQMDRHTVISESRQQMYGERFTSTHTFSISCSPVEANRRVHAIHSQLQPVSTEPQATPPPTVIGPLFSDIQREFQRKETQGTGQDGVFTACESTLLQDASAGGLSEVELQQQEVMTEDYFSNDEYDCASPDDISLPPLAETPESNMVPSDIEEGFCFSSHSVHISQYSHQCRAQSEHSGTGPGAVRQQRESSQTENCPTPPASLHSSTRFRSESSSFAQSPMTVPAPGLLTSTLCTILRTDETSRADTPKSADLSLDSPELSLSSGSHLVHKNNTPESCSNDNNVPETKTLSQTEHLLKQNNIQYNQPQRRTGTQAQITQNVVSTGETLPQTDPSPQTAEHNQSHTLPQSSNCPQPFSDPEPDLHRDKTHTQDTRSLKCSTTLLQPLSDSESGLHQDLKSSQSRKGTLPVSKPQKNSPTNTNTSTITQQTIYFQSSHSDSHRILTEASCSLSTPQESSLSQSETLPQIIAFPQATDSVPSCAACPQIIPQDSHFSKAYPNSRSGLNQEVPSSQTSQETSLISVPQNSSLTTASTVTLRTLYCQSSPPKSHHTLPQARSNLRSTQESSLSQTETLPKMDPVSQAQDRIQDTGSLKSCATCPKNFPQDSNLPKAYPDSRSGLDEDVTSSKTSKEMPSVSMPQSSGQTAATVVTQQTINCQSSPPNSHCKRPQASRNLMPQQGSPLSQGSEGQPEAHAPILPDPNSFSNVSISNSNITSSNRFSSKQSHQTVYSLHESLTSDSTRQCVHDPGMIPSSPAKPTAPPQPESQTQALAQQANLHVTPLSSPPHLLTPDQDPNICQPMAIREEIRLTPQIQGPSLPAPPTPSQAQAESLPQGKASKPGPPCITRPLSRATVMEGSPVTLEVEVTGHPEPTLTWFKDGEVSATGPSRELACVDRKHFLFVPEASDSDGELYQARAENHHDAAVSSGDKWLVAEVFDIISEDWQTWFGTLCVLLWLLYLIVL